MRSTICSLFLIIATFTCAQQPAIIPPAARAVSLNAATAAGAGSAYQLAFSAEATPPNRFTWDVVVTGSPASQTTNLEASDDLIIRRDGVATASSATFTSAMGGFTAADVGKEITIAGAGAAGATLVTTISAVGSATSITLTNAASTSVSSASYRYARWYTLDSSTTTTSEMRHVVNKPVLWVRANLSAISGGTSPTVSVGIVPAAQ